jgi:hypothetical protein
MKAKIIIVCIFFSLVQTYIKSQAPKIKKDAVTVFNYIEALKDTLNQLSNRTNNEFFKLHCQSMIDVINSKTSYTAYDSSLLADTYTAFCYSGTNSARDQISYLNRSRRYIISWTSPTDGEISFSWLSPPINWNPEKEYPLYVQLHGLWDVASNSIEYLTYPFRTEASTATSFEDGYLLEPWGRGNLWYEGISETDIWESIAALEKKVKINQARKYLSGHSMGGYGAWSIASKSANTWAALGIHAGAIWYNNYSLVNSSVAESLKDLPTYFVCGTNDGLLGINQTAYQLLIDAGNQSVQFVTFEGGHIYIEENVENMYLWMRQFVNDNYENIKNEKLSVSSHLIQLRNYPNPVKTNTTIFFKIQIKSYVNLSLYDINGRKIKELLNNEKIPGEYEVFLNTSVLTSGIYILRLSAAKLDVESKMVVIK